MFIDVEVGEPYNTRMILNTEKITAIKPDEYPGCCVIDMGEISLRVKESYEKISGMLNKE